MYLNDEKREAFLAIGKPCLELAGCNAVRVSPNPLSILPNGFVIERPDDGLNVPRSSLAYSNEEDAWLMASVSLLRDERECIEVLVQAFKTPVSFEYRKIGPHPHSSWSVYVPETVKCECGQHLWDSVKYGASAKTLPLAIALCFLAERGVSIDQKYINAIEAEE